MRNDLKHTNDVLNKFGKYVIQQSRSNLTRGKKNVSKELYDSLSFDSKAGPNSLYLEFFMNHYGMFQDQGVKGTEKGRSLSNFSFKQSSNLLGLELATGIFAKWAQARNMKLRDENGRFKKGGLKSLGIMIALSVKKKGIRPSMFFTTPFERAFERLDDQIVEAFSLDIDDFIDYTTKNILKDGKN